MKKKPFLNIPTGTIRGSEEERLQKLDKKRSKESQIADYLEILSHMRDSKGNPGEI